MESSLSNLVNNLSEGIHKVKCKFGQDKFQDDSIEYKCLSCNKNYQQKFDEKVKEQYFNTYKL